MAEKIEHNKNKVRKEVKDADEEEGNNFGYEYGEAPDILILDDDEKFKDDDGNIVEI
jgi:hypothetical protein